jgi:hypothetical protein
LPREWIVAFSLPSFIKRAPVESLRAYFTDRQPLEGVD